MYRTNDINFTYFIVQKEAAVGFPASRGSAVSVSHRDPEWHGFTLVQHFSGAPRVLFMKNTDILMKDKCYYRGFCAS